RLGCPTPPGIIDPSKAPFILGHDHNRARVPSVSLLEESLDLLGEVFLNASCSAALACGWRGRGTTLRHRWRLIPSCILKSNSHIGEVGQGTDAVGISSELGEACAERVLQSIKGRERLVGQDLLPQFFPDMLGWIEFRTAGRLGQYANVLGHD